MNREELEQLLMDEFSICDRQILDNLYIYYELLVETSKVMNLTTITELEESYIKHFYDSLLLSKIIPLNDSLSLADIGTGAGFPGLVLKIVYPNLTVTLIEPTLKRCNFLSTVIQKLGLKKIQVINARAEDYIKKARGSFDVVTARAVAALPMLLELCVPFVKVDHHFIALKGSSYKEELIEASNAIDKLKVKCVKETCVDLPLHYGSRALLMFRKVEKTNVIYPRKYALIKSKPL